MHYVIINVVTQIIQHLTVEVDQEQVCEYHILQWSSTQPTTTLRALHTQQHIQRRIVNSFFFPSSFILFIYLVSY